MYSLEYGTWTDELKDAFKHNVTRAKIFYDEGEINEDNGLKDLTLDEQRYISNYGFVGTATAKKLELNLISKLYSRNIFNNYLQPSFKNSGVIEWGTSTGKRITMQTSGTWKSCIYVVKNLTNYVGKTIRLKTDFVRSGTNIPRYSIGLCDANGNNREQKGWSEKAGATISFVVPKLDGTKNYLYVGLAANTTSETTQVGDYVEYTNIVVTIDNENMEYEPYINPNINLENKELDLKIGADYNGETYYIYYGKYIVDKPPEIDETTGTIRVVAYDYMIKFNKPYVDRVTYPCTLLHLLEDVCNQAGVALGGYSGAYTIPNGNFIVENNQFEGYTLRQVLQEIAKCTFSWAYIGQDNHLYLDFYKDGDITETITIDDYKANAFKKANEYYGPVNQVTYADSNIQGQEARVKDQQSIDENGLKELVIYDNLFAYTPEKRAELIQEGTRLLGLKYMPISQLELIGLAYLDCRDIIEVETLDNEIFTSRVFSHQIRYNGTLHDSIVTEGTSDAEEAYKNTANSIFQNQQTRIIVDKANKRIESVVEDVQETLEDYPTIVEMNSAITQKANEITSTVSETYSTKTETANAINSIDVGGRNYLLETNQGQKRWYFNVGNKYKKPTFEDINWLGQNALQFTTQELNETYTTNWKILQYNDYTLKRKLEPNTEYIVCFDCNYKHYHISIAEGNSTNNLIQNYTSNITDCVDINGDTYYHMEFKFTTKPILNITSQILRIEALGEYLDNPGTIVKIANLKLEKGNKATEWSPAPEDIQNELHDNYSTTIQMNSAITQKANEITSEVSQTYTTKTETIEAIKNIDVGGRNYALGTGVANIHENQNKNNDGYNLYDLSLTVAELNQVPSGKLICSFDMELSADMTGSSGTPYIAVGQLSSPWNRVDVTETKAGKYHKRIVLENRAWTNNKIGVRANYLDLNTTLTISNLKVEIGDTYTGWTPAPEDYPTTVQMQSAIDQKADSITSTVAATYTTKTDFNNLEVGGRNLAKNGAIAVYEGTPTTSVDNTNFVKNGSCVIKRIKSAVNGGPMIDKYVPFTENEEYVISFKMKVIEGDVSYFYVWNDSTKKHKNTKVCVDGELKGTMRQNIPFPEDNEWHNVEIYFTAVEITESEAGANWSSNHIILQPAKNEADVLYNVELLNFKIEKGNKPTDWTPAPEDIENKFLDYSTTVEMNSAITQKANEITSSVSETYTTKADFNNLEIGGRNFILNSDFKADNKSKYGFENCTGTILHDDTTYGSYLKVVFTQAGRFYYNLSNFWKANQKYGVSFMVKTDDTDVTIQPSRSITNYATKMNVTSNWQRYTGIISSTQTTTGGTLSFSVNKACTIYITLIKLEVGNKVTDWTPAPGDYSTTVEMNSVIDQKADSITSTVSATYTTKADFNNLEVGGRNYFEGTTSDWRNLILTNVENEVIYLSNATDLKTKGLKAGDVLRVSFYVKLNVSSTATSPHSYLMGTRNYGGNWASINIDGGSMEARLKEIMNSSSKEGYVQTYITLPSNFNNGTYTEKWYIGVRFDYYMGAVKVKNLMVSKGDKYLDWTPAPEDIYTDLDNNYYTKTQTESKITQTAESINTEVSKKVGSNEIISKINQSAEAVTINANKLNLNGYVTATNLKTAGSTTINGENITTGTIKSSNYVANTSGTSINLTNGVIDTKGFKVNSTGRVTATSGEIGGFELDSNNGFNANITLPYTYTQNDIDRVRNIIMGNISPTQQDYDKYDFTQTGEINGVDYVICAQIVKNTRTSSGTFKIDSKNSKKCIQIIDDTGRIVSSIGLFGAYFSRIQCEANIFSDGDIYVGDTRQTIIGDGGIVLRDANNDSVITLSSYDEVGQIECTTLNQRLVNGTGNNYNILTVGEDISRFNFKRGNHSINGRVDDTNNKNNVYLSVTDGTNTSNIFPTQIDTPLLIQTSKESVKKNIEKYLGNASSIVRDSEIYTYNFKSEEDDSKKHIGFIIGDQGGDYKTPEEVISNGEGIDTYTMTSILWKAVQEQQKIIEQFQKEINELKEERK